MNFKILQIDKKKIQMKLFLLNGLSNVVKIWKAKMLESKASKPRLSNSQY